MFNNTLQAASRAQRAAELILGRPAPDDNAPDPQPTPAGAAELVASEQDAPPVMHPVDAGAVPPRPGLPTLPLVVLGQETLPSLTTVVVATQRIELTRLLEHPAFTDEQRRMATGRIMAEADPARLGRWLTNIMQRVAEWEERTLAEEARQHPRPYPSDDC
ncbi:hypothetical protein [Hymenobacter algoricola]|uniref:Uncharacterized protein n=1 Tax=Hymenobacter algoricola TaxID=486267 RepID=A0ABP7NG47_9BACT